MSSYNPESVVSRLKPPPTAVNFDRKVIKLSQSSAPGASGFTTSSHKRNEQGTENKKIGVIKLNSPRVTNVVKNKSLNLEDVVIKTFSKDSSKTVTKTDKSVAEPVNDVACVRKAIASKIKLKRPDANAVTLNITDYVQGSNGSEVREKKDTAKSPMVTTEGLSTDLKHECNNEVVS